MPLCGHCQAPHAQVYHGRDTGTRVLACSPECAKRCAMQHVGGDHAGITMRDELERRNETTRKLAAQLKHIENKARLSAVIGRVLALLVATEENPMGAANDTELLAEMDGIVNDLKAHYDAWEPRPEKKLICGHQARDWRRDCARSLHGATPSAVPCAARAGAVGARSRQGQV